jgi:hypothetical protein
VDEYEPLLQAAIQVEISGPHYRKNAHPMSPYQLKIIALGLPAIIGYAVLIGRWLFTPTNHD